MTGTLSPAERELLGIYTRQAYDAYLGENLKDCAARIEQIEGLNRGDIPARFLRGAITGRKARPGRGMQEIRTAVRIWRPLYEQLTGEGLEVMKAAMAEAFSTILYIPTEQAARQWDVYCDVRTARELTDTVCTLLDYDDGYAEEAGVPYSQWIHGLFTENYVFLTDEIIGYFGKRKIGFETLDAFKIGSDDKGNIVFPFYRDNVLVYVKYRAPRKPQPKEKKEWQAHNTQPILFGMDMCAFSQPLIITEGQIDCLSMYEAGIRNVVSVPSGCSNLDWIDTCWEWLEKFQNVILFGDNDEPGRKMVREVVRRLDEARCMVVEEYPLRPDGKPCKDANEILFFHEADALKTALDSAQPVPVKGI